MLINNILISLAAASVIAATAVPAENKQVSQGWKGKHQSYKVALIGDIPYGDLGKAQYPALIADINAAGVAFTTHDGDLKAGGDGPCTDENLYTPAQNYFSMFEQPVIFVPGDNDWTDCWGLYGPSTTTPKTSDPLERLQHERDLFFSSPYSLGQKKLLLTRQSDSRGKYAQYSENVRWQYGPVVFIGLNVQGSNDNYPYLGVSGETRSDEEVNRMRAEAVTRKAANLAWLNAGFEYAKQAGALGMMIVMQANLNFNNERHIDDTRRWDAYPDYINALRDQCLAFDGQVLLVHGDTHYFHMDKPLKGPTGGVLANFTRVETFGARNTHWVQVTIDANNPNLFAIEPRMVPANVDK